MTTSFKRCARCGKFVPEDREVSSLYCSDQCGKLEQQKKNRAINAMNHISQEMAVKITSLAQTKTVKEISDETKLTIRAIKKYCEIARITPVPDAPISIKIELESEIMSKLRSAARLRGLPTKDFIAKLLETIAQDNMFIAVLDDADHLIEKADRPSDFAPKDGDRPSVVSTQIRTEPRS